jgi:hypothetical protein
MPGRLHTNLDLRRRRPNRCPDPIDDRSQIRTSHPKTHRTQQPTTPSIGRRRHRRTLADIDRNDNRGRRGWRNMHRHNNTSGACQENQSAPTLRSSMLLLSVYGQVQLATSQDFYFDSDSIGLRATFRFGAKIADVERVVKLAVTDLGN